MIFHSSLQLESLCYQNPPANTFTHLLNLGKQESQFSCIVSIPVRIFIHFFEGNFLVFNSARDCDMMGLVSTHQTRQCPLHWLSYLPCNDTFELMLSFYHLGCSLLYFVVIFRIFAAKGPMVFIIDQLKSSWVTTASSSVHLNHESIIFSVTEVQLNLLLASFPIIPLLLVGFFSILTFLSLQEVRKCSSVTTSNHLSDLLNAVKFLHQEDEPHYKDKAIIRRLRTQACTLQKEGDLERPQTKEDLEAQSHWLPW